MDKSWKEKVDDLESRGWTLTAIGDAIGLSVSGVSDIKQERTKAPTGMAAVKLHYLHSTGAAPPHTKVA
jgi:hypothetical protein